MPTLSLLFDFYFLGVIAGAIYSYLMITASRKAGQRPGLLRTWLQMPLSSWRYEPDPTTAILIHTIAVLVISLLALSAASNNGILSIPLFTPDATIIALVWFIQCGSLLVIGYQLGALLLGFPLIVFRRAPVAIAITEQGMLFGSTFLPWHWFSHFSLASHEGILRLFSAFSPDLPSLILKPPDSIPLKELEDILHDFLPLQPAQAKRAWYQTKSLLVPIMLLACLPVIVITWLVSHLQRELALFGIALFTVTLAYLGGRLLKIFAFGVFSTNTSSPTPTNRLTPH
jgi:hypothetical protein